MAEVTLTDQNFEEEVLQSNLPVLVDFWGAFCPPCLVLAPTIERVAEEFEGKVKVGKLDVTSNPRTPQKYGVKNVPTLILFKDGQEVERLTGLRSQRALTSWIKKYLE